MLLLPTISTVTSSGVIFCQPSVTSKVTVMKFVFVFSNWSAARPIFVVPASFRVAVSLPLKVKSFVTSYSVLSVFAV